MPLWPMSACLHPWAALCPLQNWVLLPPPSKGWSQNKLICFHLGDSKIQFYQGCYEVWVGSEYRPRLRLCCGGHSEVWSIAMRHLHPLDTELLLQLRAALVTTTTQLLLPILWTILFPWISWMGIGLKTSFDLSYMPWSCSSHSTIQTENVPLSEQ